MNNDRSQAEVNREREAEVRRILMQHLKANPKDWTVEDIVARYTSEWDAYDAIETAWGFDVRRVASPGEPNERKATGKRGPRKKKDIRNRITLGSCVGRYLEESDKRPSDRHDWIEIHRLWKLNYPFDPIKPDSLEKRWKRGRNQEDATKRVLHYAISRMVEEAKKEPPSIRTVEAVVLAKLFITVFRHPELFEVSYVWRKDDEPVIYTSVKHPHYAKAIDAFNEICKEIEGGLDV